MKKSTLVWFVIATFCSISHLAQAQATQKKSETAREIEAAKEEIREAKEEIKLAMEEISIMLSDSTFKNEFHEAMPTKEEWESLRLELKTAMDEAKPEIKAAIEELKALMESLDLDWDSMQDKPKRTERKSEGI